MSETFLEYLQKQKADGGMIQQAMRYYLAEKSPDMTPPKMRTALSELEMPQRALTRYSVNLNRIHVPSTTPALSRCQLSGTTLRPATYSQCL
jgi:hypothetical protein